MNRIKELLKHKNIDYIENFDIAEISTIKISAILKIAIFPKCVDDLAKVLKCLWQNKIEFIVMGNVSNVLFCKGVLFPVIITSKMKDEYEIKGNMVSFSAGMQLSRALEISKRNKLGGLEGLFGIPATVGGAIINNAGAFNYNISSKLVSIKVFHDGNIKTIDAESIKFGYHYSNLKGIVLLSASFLFENKSEYDIIKLYNEYTYKRTASQPNGLSLGSVYQKVNGLSAGFYIERAGLKGVRVGGVYVSSKHSNFFLNDKSGSSYDFLRLQKIVEDRVEKQFGVSLISEIEKVGDNNEIICRSPHTFKKL